LNKSTTFQPQLDIVIYNKMYPVLKTPPFIDSSDNIPCCYYKESIMAVIEVKTTLTNQDLKEVAKSANVLSPLNVTIVTFKSQVVLDKIDVSVLSSNVNSIHILDGTCAGSLIQQHEHSWKKILSSYSLPLLEFYTSILQQLIQYATQNDLGSLYQMFRVLLNYTTVTTEEGEGVLHLSAAEKAIIDEEDDQEISNTKFTIKSALLDDLEDDLELFDISD